MEYFHSFFHSYLVIVEKSEHFSGYSVKNLFKFCAQSLKKGKSNKLISEKIL